jgi:hypothetical protein
MNVFTGVNNTAISFSPVSTTLVISFSPVSTTLSINLSPVSTTLAINPCHGISVIAGVVDTRNKFIAGDNNFGD